LLNDTQSLPGLAAKTQSFLLPDAMHGLQIDTGKERVDAPKAEPRMLMRKSQYALPQVGVAIPKGPPAGSPAQPHNATCADT
jgi:hypothetical protein